MRLPGSGSGSGGRGTIGTGAGRGTGTVMGHTAPPATVSKAVPASVSSPASGLSVSVSSKAVPKIRI